VRVLLNHPHATLTELRRVLAGSCHGLHPLSEWALRETRYDSKRANSTRSVSVTAMAAATAMFRVANSVASVNRSDRDAPVTPATKPPRNDVTTNVAAYGTVRARPLTKPTGSRATINAISVHSRQHRRPSDSAANDRRAPVG
jgi:hypothetical protein